MKNLYTIVNKKYNKKLVDIKTIKPIWKHMKEHMEQCKIQVGSDHDEAYFQYEIIENSLQAKERFEEVFFDTYVHMYDYWKDLTYQERKKQMNVEIAKLKHELNCFLYGDQEIYMPCFEDKFNQLYTDEIVLLDLKQYHVFIREFASQIRYDLYGADAFLHHFSSAQLLCQKDQDFVVYHPAVNRFYRYRKHHFEQMLSFDPKHGINDESLKATIAELFMEDDEDAIIKLLLENDIVSSRLKKKIKTYEHKKAKRFAKQHKKQQKKQED